MYIYIDIQTDSILWPWGNGSLRTLYRSKPCVDDTRKTRILHGLSKQLKTSYNWGPSYSRNESSIYRIDINLYYINMCIYIYVDIYIYTCIYIYI